MNRFLLLVLCVHWTVFTSSVGEKTLAMTQEAARQSSRCNTHLDILKGEARFLKGWHRDISEQYHIVQALQKQLVDFGDSNISPEEQQDIVGEIRRLKDLLPEDVCRSIQGAKNLQQNQTVIQQKQAVIERGNCAGLSGRAATVVAGLTVSMATAFVFTLGAMYGASK